MSKKAYVRPSFKRLGRLRTITFGYATNLNLDLR